MRARVASWVTPVIRVLPYLVLALILIVPLVFATALDSFLAFYERIWEAFGRGRVVDGVAGLLQLALLAIAVAGVALTFALAGRRLGVMAWRWSEGKPVLRAGLSSARFGLAIVAVAAVGVALFTWLPSGDRATTDSGNLKEALERAGNQVATLLGADDDTASAEEVDPEASGPGQLFQIITESVLPQRDREEPSNASEPSTTKGSSSERSNPDEQPNNKTFSPSPKTDEEKAEPNPVTLAPRGPVPTVAEAPPMSTEEPAATAPAEPLAAEEPPPVVEEEPPPPVVEEQPPPVVVEEEPPPVTEEPPPPVTEPPQTPDPSPETPPPKAQPDDALPNQNVPSYNCTTSPGEEPGSTTTRCTTEPAS